MTVLLHTLCGLGLVLLPGLSLARGGEAGASPAEQRAALYAAAARGAAGVADLEPGLAAENVVVRRTAARLLVDQGEAAAAALGKALGNPDLVVRRTALVGLWSILGPRALPHLLQAVTDSEPVVRLAAVERLAMLQPRTPDVQTALDQAAKDADPAVRALAAAAVWPFHKAVTSVRNRPDWDHDIKVTRVLPLPLDGWRLQTDPQRDGHRSGWFTPGLDDSAWRPVAIGQTWEKQGLEYDGVAWYRAWFDLPDKPKALAVELCFESVDECAWVWVNGEYVGQHDLGPEGWDKPFALDVSAELRWGQRNQVTVRVLDSAQAGGIWKPVALEVLE